LVPRSLIINDRGRLVRDREGNAIELLEKTAADASELPSLA